MVKQILFDEQDDTLQTIYRMVIKHHHPDVQVEYTHNIDDFINKAVSGNQYDLLMSREKDHVLQAEAAKDIRKHGINTPIYFLTDSKPDNSPVDVDNVHVHKLADSRYICDVISQHITKE